MSLLLRRRMLLSQQETKSKNLFDINNTVQTATSIDSLRFKSQISADGVISFAPWHANAGGGGFVIPIEPNTVFTASWEVVEGSYYTGIYAFESLNDDGTMKNYTVFGSYKDVTSVTYTQPKGNHFIMFALNSIGGRYKAKIKNLEVMYKENLLDINLFKDGESIGYTVDENGTVTFAENTADIRHYIRLTLPAGTYALVSTCSQGCLVGGQFFGNDGYGYGWVDYNTPSKTFKFSTEKTRQLYIVKSEGYSGGTIKNIQLCSMD